MRAAAARGDGGVTGFFLTGEKMTPGRVESSEVDSLSVKREESGEAGLTAARVVFRRGPG